MRMIKRLLYLLKVLILFIPAILYFVLVFMCGIIGFGIKWLIVGGDSDDGVDRIYDFAEWPLMKLFGE